MDHADHPLRPMLSGRVCLVGIGNVEAGDDGIGVRLAEALAGRLGAGAGSPLILVAGPRPEDHLSRLTRGDCDSAVFLDAVDFGGPPGALTVLGSEDIQSRFPQISTHRLSLGLLARLIQESGSTRVWLLGVQPASLRPGHRFSHSVQATFEALTDLLEAACQPGGATAVSRDDPASASPASC